jgi:D-alanine-D-alanine ligase
MKLKIGVLFGGQSVEHEVSIISAAQAMAALDREKYDVVPVYLSKHHLLFTSDRLMEMETYRDLDKLEKSLPQVSLIRKGNKFLLNPVNFSLFAKAVETVPSKGSSKRSGSPMRDATSSHRPSARIKWS